ncbi:MAG TPA: TIGR03118 family protein [Mucilaginibacter sp.]|jgi:uncharacterized protein (TIGR03118 family)
MKKKFNTKLIVVAILAVTCFYACKKDMSTTPINGSVPHNGFGSDNSATPILQTNLVASGLGMGALIIDPGLKNPMGLAASLTSPAWIADNKTNESTIYDRHTGLTLLPPVGVRGQSNNPGAPTGVIFNSTADFGGNKFIFAALDGTISAWGAGIMTTVVIDRSGSNAEYTGLAIAFNGLNNNNYLYACNFNAGTIDVFDKNFNYIPGLPVATDPNIPAGYAPYNIVNIGGDLYVTYAQQDPPSGFFARAGMGFGIVDVLDNHGEFLRRLATSGDLNAPWGIALAPAGFAGPNETLLVANNGSGRIDMFDLNGTYQGQLLALSKHLTIDGLWGIDFFKGNQHGVGAATDSLYFTAGPKVPSRNQGLFGFLTNH